MDGQNVVDGRFLRKIGGFRRIVIRETTEDSPHSREKTYDLPVCTVF